MNMLNLIKKNRINLSLRSQLKIVLSLVLTVAYCSAALSATVIQNGRGLVGVMNETYSTALTGTTTNEIGFAPYAYINMIFYNEGSNCRVEAGLLMEIDGVKGVKFNTAGTLMLVPEVTYIDNRTWDNGSSSDTVTAMFNGYGTNTNQNLGYESGCMWFPNQSTPNNGIDANVNVTHRVTATGRVLIYGTGTQQSGSGSLTYPFKLMLRNPRSPGPYPSGILVNAGSYSVLVTNLGCTLTTPTLVEFGPQPANATANQALASKTVNLSVSCQQSQNPISATLTLLAGINPTYYSGDNYQVNLNNSSGIAGAYVKMDMDINGASIAIPFNRQFIDIGNITAAENATSFSYPVTYTLYSRGAGITGKVSGSVELSLVLR
ncbi:hypothetical protein [Serratia fonticola]|uniref:hypothetical protein n=1 Tax=Serratia fonticola TaxID=47917 RepID=UPI003AAC1E03